VRIQRTIPPAAAPIYLRDFLNGLRGLIRGRREIERFRTELKEYFGVRHCYLVSSGRAALTVILRSLRDLRPERDEVLIPAFTCFSVPSAVVRAGLKARPCDIDPNTLDFDYSQLSRILSSSDRILAIIPTHLFGIPANVGKVQGIVDGTDAAIVEDAAQAMGGVYRGEKMGTAGDVGLFSLGRGKAFSTIEGGIIITNNTEIAARMESHIQPCRGYKAIELIRLILDALSLSFFLNPLLFWLPKSLPFLKLGETVFDPGFRVRKMSSFQAGLAKHWLWRLYDFSTKRMRNAELWRGFVTSPVRNGYKTPAAGADSGSGLIRFPILVKEARSREAILNGSQRLGLGIMPTYPDSIDGIRQISGGSEGQKHPVAKELVEQMVTLPTHPLLSERDRAKIERLMASSSGSR